jgi:hypothetical protein
MPIDTRELTELDLKFYLASIEKRKDQYRADQTDYAKEMLKKLEDMAFGAIQRFHAQ